MSLDFDTERWAERRRPFDRLEARLVRLALAADDEDAKHLIEATRYALSFARLTQVRNPDGHDVDLSGPLAAHSAEILRLAGPRIEEADNLWQALRDVPEIIRRTRLARTSVLGHLPVHRDALEGEVTERLLAVVSGGGGGAGYVYPGVYDMIDRIDLEPSLLVGTSIGALMSMFRARKRRLDLAALVAAARVLSWTKVFRVLQTESRYGLPATLRLYLRSALGELFEGEDGPMRLSEMAIPIYIVSTGITVDALKHDLDYYEHFLDDSVRTTRTMRARSGLKAMSILREFMGRRDALREMVLGRTKGTEEFDTLDAAGFSAAIPAVIHYDVLRDDPRMKALLDDLYATYGITRLGEGGMVANVPARIAWETITSGKFGRRNSFVLALDCFAPHRSRLGWYPFQQLVRQSNVIEDMKFADLYLDFPKTPSPLNLVPALPDAMQAIRWGRARVKPDLPFISEMMRTLSVLADK